MSSLLILEPHSEGHHLRYVRWISGEAVGRGYDVWLATSDACFEHPAYHALQKECGTSLRTVMLPEGGSKPRPRNVLGSLKLQLHYRRLFGECYRRLSRSERPDYVFIPYLDYCNYAMALLGSPFDDTPWGGLVITPIFHLRDQGLGVPASPLEQAKEKLFLRLLDDRSLRAAYTFDETLIQQVRREGHPKAAGRLRFLPEPTELDGTHTRESARRDLRIPSDATVILVYGMLDYSKGIDALLAATGNGVFPEDTVVLLAGLQDAETKEMLSSPRARALRESGRLYERDEYLYGESEHAVFQASDIVWVGYRDQYISSGVLIQAARIGLPIVACDEGLIKWLTQRYGLGLVVGVDDTRAVAGVVSRLAGNSDLSKELGGNGRRFATAHTVERFRRDIGEELLLNFPPT